MEFTVQNIENLLSQKEYASIERINRRDLTKEQNREINEIEMIASFGQDVISLFDNMVYKKGTLPTQAEFVAEGTGMIVKWVEENKSQVDVTPIKVKGIELRLARTYMSKVTEIHLECIFAEYLPELTVKTFPMVDSVMGVDFIVEDGIKRYYTHVTSNTPFAKKLLIKKEGRGGYKKGNVLIPYNRDFRGDLMLKYDVTGDSETTKNINGFPLFKADFIETRFFIAQRQDSIGEKIGIKHTKLQHFKDWAKTYLNMSISSI